VAVDEVGQNMVVVELVAVASTHAAADPPTSTASGTTDRRHTAEHSTHRNVRLT